MKDFCKVSAEHLERLYVFTLMWSIGSFLELADRAKLAQFIQAAHDIKLDLPPVPEVLRKG